MNSERNTALQEIAEQISPLLVRLQNITDRERDGLPLASANWKVLEESKLAIAYMENAEDGLFDAILYLREIYSGGAKDAKNA